MVISTDHVAAPVIPSEMKDGSGAASRQGFLTRCRLVALLFGLLITGLIACGGPRVSRTTSVLLISPDSLRIDRLRLFNPEDGRPTPSLEALAARGTTYLNAWSTSPWTAPSMVSVMTGLFPPSHGVAYRDDTTPSALPTLPRLLAAEGHWLGNFSFFSQISYFRNLGLGPAVDGLDHATVATAFGDWLRELRADQPFFAWVHLLETHLPYGATGYRASQVAIPGSSGLERAQLDGTVPVGTVEFAVGDRQALLELYDRDVQTMDRALGTLLAALDETDRTATTLVIFVADHGEELLEHGWVGHASTSIAAKMVPEILRVPLILAGPGVPAGQERQELVQQVDILPTVIELMGLLEPPASDGRLLPGIADRWWHRPRSVAFFDSSLGGNLTPQERRDERLQAVTDGRCLVSSHSYGDRDPQMDSLAVAIAGCADASAERLHKVLEGWRKEQAGQRLEILARDSSGTAPSSAEADAFAAELAIVEPRDGVRLAWEETRGHLALAWDGDGDGDGGGELWLEYRLGTTIPVTGSFRLEQQRVMFGPIPAGFWNDLASYSPFQIRVVDAERHLRSPWVRFEVLPTS